MSSHSFYRVFYSIEGCPIAIKNLSLQKNKIYKKVEKFLFHVLYSRSMFKRLFSILCLIFLFAFTQQASIAHEISHLEDSVKHTQSHKSDLNSCSQCVSFAKLQHINDALFVFNVEETQQYTTFVSHLNSYQSLTAIYFAARAPPKNSVLN